MPAVSSSNSISTIASPTRVASACALIVAAIGLVFLASWLVVFKVPTPLLPEPASMKFNAALCFVLAGAGLWWRDHGTARVLAGLVISAVGVLTLGQQFLPVNLGIDQAFIRDLATAPASSPGRMSDLAAISFVLCGLALALLRAGSRKVRLGAEALVLCVAATQFIAFLGHATGVKFLDGVPGLHSAAVSIAAGFCIFAIGLFAGLKEGVTGRPAVPTSPTRRRVQFGFGLLTALLVTVGIFSAARLHTLEASVNALAVNARVRLAQTQELKINLLDYGLNVRVFQSGDTGSLNRAEEAAADVARHLAAYSRLAVTPPQIAFAERVAAQWQDVYVAGQALLTASPAAPRELSRLNDQRLGLEHLLEDEVQPDASASVARAEADIASGLQNAKIGTLALLVVALSCALITSSLVGQTVLSGERALREREERLRLATGAAELGIWTWNPDKDQVAGENDLFFGILGLAQSSRPLSVAGFAAKFVHPEDRETFGRAIEEALLKETRTRWDGRLYTIQGESRWIELTGQAVPGLQGTSRRVIGTIRDITSRHQAADALHRSEQRFRALFDKGPIAVYSCDTSGVIVEFNQAAAELWQRSPSPGQTCQQFVGDFNFYSLDGTRMSSSPSSLDRAKSGDAQLQNQEFLVERPDGLRMTIVSTVVALTNERGELTGAINCCYETTERSRLERETQEQARALADLHRRKDEFLAMLGHELRNPLAALSNAVQLLRLQQPEEPLQAQGRSIIERQVKQLKHLVDDLLEVSRITTGSVRLRQQQVNLHSVVERALETAQPMISGQQHELSVALPPQPVYVNADGARLEQVLVNLLSNAAKYTEKGGRIWLEVEEDGKNVAIKVRDNGIGIAPDLLPHIFELFTQAERSLDRSQGGLGIGLSLVQRLVELHGGTVVAHSKLGSGSEFVVRMPLMMVAAPTPPAPLPDTAQHSGGLHVLVVDDNVDAAESLAVLLEMTGHAVRLAYDGPSALQAVVAHQPDVVLLDIGLPGLDGFEVAQKIRLQASLSRTVLVALTGYGQDGDRKRALDVGFNYHLVKPADFGEIEKILTTVQQTAHSSS